MIDEAKKLDAIDIRIIRSLQQNGRASFDELSSLVSLSPSATLRRVRWLEEQRFIVGYTALINATMVGFQLVAHMNVRLVKHRDNGLRAPAEEFSAAVHAWPEIVECVSLTGEMDYFLKVMVKDMEHYSRFVMECLLRHPSVQDCKSSFVLDKVKFSPGIPV